MQNQAIGMLQAGVSQWWVTRRFNVLLHSKPVIAQVFIQQNQQWIFQNMITVCTNPTSQSAHMPTSFARTFHVASPWLQWPRRGKFPPKRTALTSLISCCVHWPNRAFVGRAYDMCAPPSASVSEPGRTFKREDW